MMAAGGKTMKRLNLSFGAWMPVIRALPSSTSAVALSYDDGPNPDSTPDLLDVLDAHGAKASFFLCGFRAVAHPELVGEIVRRGHHVYAHGWDHVRHDRLPARDMIDSLERTEELLRRWRPTPRPYLVRLPHHGGYRRGRVHRALRRWQPAPQYAHTRTDWPDYQVPTRCRAVADVEPQCADAVRQLFATHDLAGSVLILHDQPVGIASAHAAEVTVRLTALILSELDGRGLRAVPVEPMPGPQPLHSRFVFV
jgi:peptidoglycan-N-acetylglucosamine deacetylase